MINHRRVRIGSLLFTALAATGWPALAGENWPMWRGPQMNGVSDSTDLPVSWSDTQNVRWKTAMPSWSGATPIVWGDRVFVTSPSALKDPKDKAPTSKPMGKLRDEGRDLLLLCLSRQDGAVLWTFKLDDRNVHSGKQNMSSPSPVTDGKRVYVITGTGIFTALDFDGRPLWRLDVQKEYGKFGLLWGYASSPLLWDGKLYIQVLHGSETDAPAYLLGIDPQTGKVLWKVDRPTDALLESPDAYSTPVPFRQGDRTLIALAGGDYITAHDAGTGREVWRCGGLNPKKHDRYRGICSPLVACGMAFGSIRDGPLVACRLGGTGLVTSTHLAWSSEHATDVPTPVSDDKHLYVLHDRGFFSCLDPATGKPLYAKQRLPRGTYSGSPLLAGERIYVVNEDARTAVIATGPEFKIISENAVDGGYTLSSPVAAGRELFLRTAQYLYCFAKSAK